ncbi:MAG: type I phosphomannose isomerase catalytic subunit [Anaerolineae bacterium]
MASRRSERKTVQHLSPIQLEPKLDCRLWGGSALGPFVGLASPPPNLAEIWLVYEDNRVVGGPHDGAMLKDLVGLYGPALVGTRSFDRWGEDFPLLAKFIDAADDLSVQVHPDDEYAHAVEAATGFHGKTEAWHILQATPEAAVIHGFTSRTDREQFADAVARGTALDTLRVVPVQAGDTIFVPAGTMHAINAGVMLFEIQEKSDLTYRVYDYDRRDAQGQLRDLHIDKALAVTNFDTAAPAKLAAVPLAPGRSLLVECPYFVMERWEMSEATSLATDAATFEILTVIGGAVDVVSEDGVVHLPRGHAVVLPATLGAYQLVPAPDVTLLRCYVP